MPQYDVFLSYSSSNLNIMQQVYKDLTAAGFRVWIDKTGIPVGSPSWRLAIQDGIESSQCLVVILSPDAKKSQWVNEELSYAQTHDKQVFAIFALGDEKTAIPFGYATNQWTDIRENYDISKLVEQINKQISQEANTSHVISEPVVSPTTQASTPRPQSLPQPHMVAELFVLNPLDWFKLIWWILAEPHKYLDYKRKFGKPVLVGALIAGTILFIPFFIPALEIASQAQLLSLSQAQLYYPVSNNLFLFILWLVFVLMSGFYASISVVITIIRYSIHSFILTLILIVVGYSIEISSWHLFFAIGVMLLGMSGNDKRISSDPFEGAKFISATIGLISVLLSGLIVWNFAENILWRIVWVLGIIIGSFVGMIFWLLIDASTRGWDPSIEIKLEFYRGWDDQIPYFLYLILHISSYIALIYIYWFGGWQVLP